MNARLMVLTAVVASSTLFTMCAQAHGSMAVPATCAQLADSHNYSNDVTNPAIKALQARCDGAKKAAAKKPAAKKASAQPKAMAKPAASKSNHGHSHDGKPSGAKEMVQEKKTVAATPISPEYIQLAKNVEIIPNVETAVKSVGTLTHEGLFGPLLYAENTRSFFIELKPGMFLSEHPHATGSIIYTIRGKWVLASEGKRQVMEAGSLFRFGDNMPTGWEAPFAEGALLLVVKMKEKGDNYEPFNKGMQDMKALLEKERASGTPFYFNALQSDHPAVVFAKEVNPKFDDVVRNIRY